MVGWRLTMIRVTRLNHAPLVLNSDLIEHIETTPDTVISLTSGQKIVVLETADELVRRVIEFRSAILRAAGEDDRGTAAREEGG
jgi:flagellar protein FlbD